MLLAGKGFEPIQRRKPQRYRLELERGMAYLRHAHECRGCRSRNSAVVDTTRVSSGFSQTLEGFFPFPSYQGTRVLEVGRIHSDMPRIRAPVLGHFKFHNA